MLGVPRDLNLALRYADDVLLLSAGRVAAAGPIHATLTAELTGNIFGLPLHRHTVECNTLLPWDPSGTGPCRVGS